MKGHPTSIGCLLSETIFVFFRVFITACYFFHAKEIPLAITPTTTAGIIQEKPRSEKGRVTKGVI